MQTVKLTLGATVLAILLAGSTSAFATPIPVGDGGVLNISGSGLLGLTSVPQCFNFGGGTACAAGIHSTAVSGASADFAAPSAGTIEDFTGSSSVSLFETVAGAGPLAGLAVKFDLTSLVTNGAQVGNCSSNAPNNTCKPINSPLTLSENATATQVTLSFTVMLDAYTGSHATGFTPYQGVFTSMLSGVLGGAGTCSGLAANITNILACEAAGGTIAMTWSATEAPTAATSEVPEPVSIALLASGLVGLGLRRRRSRSVS